MINGRSYFIRILGIFITWSCLTAMADADSLLYTHPNEKDKKLIRDVIVLSDAYQRVEYLTIQKGYCVIKNTLYINNVEASDVKVAYSSKEDKKKLLEGWKEQTYSAYVQRTFGPSMTVAAFGMRYPLPPNVIYIGGPPAERAGPEIYVGKDSSNASSALFKDMQSVEFLKNGTVVRVLWMNSESFEGDLLPFWKYGDRPGGPPLFFGINMDTLSFIEIPLNNLRKIVMAGNKTIQCSGSPAHALVEPPTTWKYCPICGKPLKTTQ